uniref:Uncharacterized protein n=1 Tax=Arundo donax TaxID=35708 RepID=A0A0A9A4Q1_ARUDO
MVHVTASECLWQSSLDLGDTIHWSTLSLYERRQINFDLGGVICPSLTLAGGGRLGGMGKIERT